MLMKRVKKGKPGVILKSFNRYYIPVFRPMTDFASLQSALFITIKLWHRQYNVYQLCIKYCQVCNQKVISP